MTLTTQQQIDRFKALLAAKMAQQNPRTDEEIGEDSGPEEEN